MKHIVGLSGGKDSTALALRLAEVEPREYEYICNETGNELPEMQQHWANLEKLLGAPILRVRHERGLEDEIKVQRMLPSVFGRWCTRVLKIEPTIGYFETVQLYESATLYVGLRADEELREGLYGEDMTIRFPLREWGWDEARVYGYLEERGVCIPKRTDCGLCPYQRLGEWQELFFQHPDIYKRGEELEREVGATFRSPGRDTWPAGLTESAAEFLAGRKLRQRKKDLTPRCRVCTF